MNESILVGGTGFIGSHACVALIQAGYHVIILDNLSNSILKVLKRLNMIVGLAPNFVQADTRDCMATTTKHLMALVCVITFMSWIWQRGMYPPYDSVRQRVACSQ